MTMIEAVNSDSPRYNLLGPLRVLVGEEEIAVTSLLQRKILVSLLLSPGSVVSADALEFILWQDDPPKTARKTLHTLVSRLRGVLDSGEIVTQPPGYLIEVDDSDVDAILFERLVADAGSRIEDEPASALDIIERALGLWSGPAIAEFADEEFAMTEAHRLDELRLIATEVKFDALLALDRHQAVIPELEAFIARHRFREKPRNRLMTALFRSGRTPDALSVYKEFREIMSEELGLDPSPELQDLELRILNQDDSLGSSPSPAPGLVPTRPASRISRRLPQPPVLLGRQGELDHLAELASEPLTTVVGPGGVGKTSLVSVWSDTQDNVSIVELCDVRSGDDLLSAMSQQLGMDTHVGDHRESLITGLTTIGGILVLDNCESLLEPVGEFVTDVIRLAPDIRIVATSRQRLGLPDEQVLNLEPLHVPDGLADPKALRANQAIRLFLDRAHRADSAFRVTGQELATVAEICRLVDGLPLAIELAAARAPVFGVEDLAEQITSDISVLELGKGRQRSLARVLDWSIGLLDNETKKVLATAALFEGGFLLDPLAQVHGRGNLVVNVGRLVDASLAYRVPDTHPRRFKLHVPTRIHVRESIGVSVESARRFVDWGHDFVTEMTSALGLPGEEEARKSLVAESANVVATAQTALETGNRAIAFGIVEKLGKADLIGNPALAGLLDEIADSYISNDGAEAIGALAAAARSAAVRGLQAEALSRARRAEECANGTWHRGLYMATHARGLAAYFSGDEDQAVALLAKVANDERVPIEERVVASFDQVLVLGQAGHLKEARALASRAYDTALEHAGESVIAHAVFALATIDLMDDPSSALEAFNVAIQRARKADSGLIERISRLCRIISLMQLDRDDDAVSEIPDLVDTLVVNGVHALSLARVTATLALRAGDLETAGLLAQAYESHSETPRFGIIVNATRQIEEIRSLLTEQEWTDLGERAMAMSPHDVMRLVKSVASDAA